MSKIILKHASTEILKRTQPYIDPWVRLVHNGAVQTTPVVGGYRDSKTEIGKGCLYLDDYNEGDVYAFAKRRNEKKPEYILYKGGKFFPCDKNGEIKNLDDMTKKKQAHYRFICNNDG